MNNFDIILFGATSFVGQITAKYLAKKYGVNKSIKWAIAGRSHTKLKQLKQELTTIDPAASQLEIFTADSSDFESLCNITNKTKVILTTVGPYYLYGEQLVAACAETGTDYCDLTGEAAFARKMQDKYASKAKQTGSRIIHCCGFDSMPSDLGVHFTNQQSLEKFQEPVIAVNTYVTKMKGTASGGTIASMVAILDAIRKDHSLSKQIKNPYCLCPDDKRSGVRQKSNNTYYFSKDINKWVAPFVMASINTKIVHASNALQNYPYGKEFHYNEMSACKNKLKAMTLHFSLIMLFATLYNKFTRKFILKYFLPKPGEGPTIEQQENGKFELTMHATTKSGHKFITKVCGDKDPGYGSTAQMFAEAGICLATDISKQQISGGFWTPASILGDKLITRLSNNAGVKFVMIS